MDPSSLSKVEELRPCTQGYSLLLKVLSAKPVAVHRPSNQRPGSRQQGPMRISECIVGDDTGVVVFTARNEQVDVMKVGATVEVTNAKVDMYKGSMRLAVDSRRGTLKAAESPASELKVKEDNNLSLVEFEQITMMM
uniref:Uncharacterized protein n=1 Tax=Avena sativa TaxID=4498 RepID=A0ACD5Y7X7_AVESA